MTLFQQTVFRLASKSLLILIIVAQATFALQIEAPELSAQILAYSQEIGMENRNAILRASIAKGTQCNTFTLKLIDKNSGKTIKKVEHCSSSLPNAALQSAVFELFGYNTKNRENPKIGAVGIQTIIGTGFAIAGILLYYSKPPKPVYNYILVNEEEK
ncbi:MAG: hypothetical protein LBC85_07405 [Fibromonadaceae bacterium]|jgi:hypothetical protein|nr:hypothetical protein [Fibromonadaceae bacterium]